MSSNHQEKPVQAKNIVIGLILLPVFGFIIYNLHSAGIDITPAARRQTNKENITHNYVKKLSELDREETAEFRNSFISNCEQSVSDAISSSQATQYCTCTEQKVEMSFTINQVNNWETLSDTEMTDTLKPYYNECASEMGLV